VTILPLADDLCVSSQIAVLGLMWYLTSTMMSFTASSHKMLFAAIVQMMGFM
jgi:hypothetical protein